MKKLWQIAHLNKSDILFLIIAVVGIILMYIGLGFVNSHESEGKVAIVTYRDKEVMRIDMSVDGTYTYDATLGTVTIEVQDGKIRVEKETSPYHYCSLQGWVEHSTTPIVCLPNELMIQIVDDSGNSSETDVNIH